MKTCSKCNQTKPYDDFYRSHHTEDGYRGKCRVCTNIKRRETKEKKQNGYEPQYRFVNIALDDNLTGTERLVAYHKEYRKIYAKEISEKKKAEENNAKIDGIKYYGGKCSCCGESIIEFLTLEHLNGRDKTKKRRTGKAAWLEAKRAGWPNDLTVLCFNCNCAKGAFGSCPHTWEK